MSSSAEAAVDRRRRDFRLFWLGGAANLLGSRATSLITPILALSLGASAVTAGALGTVGAVTEMGLMPICGVYADRWSRRILMITGLVMAAATAATIAFAVRTHTVSLSLLFGCAIVAAAASAIYSAAASGAVRALLPERDPERALSALQAREQAAGLAGPSVGGWLYQIASWVPFLADAVTFLVAAGCVRAIRSDLGPVRENGATAAPKPNFRKEFLTGLKFLWHQPFLRFVTLWAGAVNLILGALFFSVIVTARLDGASAASIGFVLTGAAAAGLTGALLAPLVLRRIGTRVLVIIASWTMAAALIPLVMVTSLWADGLMLAMVSLLAPPLSIVFQTKAIMITPDGLQSRVGTALTALGEGTAALAPLLAGLLIVSLPPSLQALSFAGALALLAVHSTIAAGRYGTDPPVPPEPSQDPSPVSTER